MLWVYGHYKYVCSYSESDVYRRQILKSKVDPRTVRVKWQVILMFSSQQKMPIVQV